MIKPIRFTVLFLQILILFSSFAFAQPSPGNEAWRVLERGKLAFEQEELGKALLYCEQAREIHIAEFKAYKENLEKALLPREVKKAGDDIMKVRSVFEKRSDSDSVAILDAILLNHPPSSFYYSIKNLLTWIDNNLVYPEADFLAGQVYEGEGENYLALDYYEKAWVNRGFLDIPDERFTLAYRMADLAYNMKNFGKREEYLQLILIEDPVYGKPDAPGATLAAMVRTLETETSTDRFFLLYRNTNYSALKAYQDLASHYYYDSGKRLDRALPVAALASTISLTHLCEVLKQADFDFTYKDFPDLLIRTEKNAGVARWAQETKLWDSFLLLAIILSEKGKNTQAESIWTALAHYCPDKMIARKAETELHVLQ